MEIKQRIFLVGTARAGTTLAQSLLAADPRVMSFPETHFFTRSLSQNKWLRRLNSLGGKELNLLKDFLQNYYPNYTNAFDFTSFNVSSVKGWLDYVLAFLDQLALHHEKTIWLEKTPMHLRYMPLVQAHRPDVNVIHQVRHPLGNVASLLEVSKEHPDAFRQPDLNRALQRYHRDALIREKLLQKPNNFLLYYEDLSANPKRELERLAAEMQVDLLYDQHFYKRSGQYIDERESWKTKNIQAPEASAWAGRLDEHQQKMIRKALKSWRLAHLDRYL